MPEEKKQKYVVIGMAGYNLRKQSELKAAYTPTENP